MSLLLDRGADINLIGGKYETALVAAAYQGETQTVSLLLDQGANINGLAGGYDIALDVIHLRDSRPNPAPLALLSTAIIKQNPNVFKGGGKNKLYVPLISYQPNFRQMEISNVPCRDFDEEAL